MTTTGLPRPIAAYIAAVNLQDIDAVTASFSEEAVVHDEGQTRRGIGAIRKWAEEVSEKYHPSVEAVSAANTGATTIVAVVNGEINPGKVFDLRLPLEQVAEGYRAMDERRAIKSLLTP